MHYLVQSCLWNTPIHSAGAFSAPRHNKFFQKAEVTPMGRQDRPHKRWHTVLWVTLLAVACISTTELIACRHFEPELYQQITAPVRRGAAAVRSTAVSAGEHVVTFLSRFKKQPEGELQADPPAVEIDSPLASAKITELKTLPDGRSVLTGGVIPIIYYNQGDEVWAVQPYGSDYIGRYGCGPTALAMAVSSLTDIAVDPAEMASWAARNGYWAKHSGSYLSIINGSSVFGLQVEHFAGRDAEELRQVLRSGKVLVALMGPGHFTKSGHFILLRGLSPSGAVLIADPNSVDHSLMEWDPQLLLDELSKSTSDGAPLWTIAPESP